MQQIYSDIAHKASAISFSRALSSLARIVSVVILARYLVKEDFGLVSFVLLTYITMTTLAELGLSESIFYFLKRLSRESQKSFVLLCARLLLLFGAACSALFIMIAFIASSRGYDVVNLSIPLTFLILLELPTTLTANTLIAIDRAKQAAWLNVLFSAMLFAAIVFPAISRQPITLVAYLLLSYGVVRFLICAFLFNRYFPGPGAPLEKGMGREILRYSIPLGIAKILLKLHQLIDKYVIMLFLPVAVFAEYTVAAWEVPFVPVIAYSVGSVLMPHLVSCYMEHNNSALLELWHQATKKVALIVLPIMILLITIAEDLIVVLFSESYASAVWVFVIYTLTLSQRVTSYSSVLKAINKTWVVTRWAIYALLLNLMLSVPAVMILGMEGVALATLFSHTVTWLYGLKMIGKGLRIPFSEVFPFRHYFKTLLVSMIAALPVVALDGWITTTHPTALVWKIAIYLISYGSLSSITGVCTQADWRFILTLMRLRPQRA